MTHSLLKADFLLMTTVGVMLMLHTAVSVPSTLHQSRAFWENYSSVILATYSRLRCAFALLLV
jgi:hypothetical protein